MYKTLGSSLWKILISIILNLLLLFNVQLQKGDAVGSTAFNHFMIRMGLIWKYSLIHLKIFFR
ncbi:hypothetical protein HMPREF0202_01797 [Cetobacterium somerae ATCC BAA-474]|uniref:Uncharacterized protein n=1 Tax=Cetobacterium somerae ATCC BAA-474 TaxID=1319815 RepID=U7V9B1_9FUSO|nr:hypothetical protein HMPREF0202_01797 [Cetobacterium somerae ATCC BAA-474]